jgi:hypothetical protein
MIHADIATKIISPETAIWVVFPGRGRRFLNDFIKNQIVFLETPALGMTQTTAKDFPAIRRHVRMSLAIANYIRTNATKVPSRNPRFYSDKPFKNRGDTVLASSVRKLFGKIKVGDLILVPGLMFEPVYFGEIISDFDTKDTISVGRYGVEEIPYRRIRWLNLGVARHMIPQLLQVYLSKPPAIAQILRSNDTEKFFNLAYTPIMPRLRTEKYPSTVLLWASPRTYSPAP